MSIHSLKEAGGKDDRGKYILHDLTMSYEDGGKIQVYKSGDREVRVPAIAAPSDIINAFKDAG